MPEWFTSEQDDLPAAIKEFKEKLPGWYYMVCECQVSCDATIAPTTDSIDIDLVWVDPKFDEGFSVDLPQPSTLAQALRHVMQEALETKAKYVG